MKFNKKVFSIFGGILVAMALFALGANSEPLHYVLTVIDGICGQNVNFSGTVKFKGITTQAFSYSDALTLEDVALSRHDHSNKTLLDTYAQSETNLADAVLQKHGHSNKTLLDTYTQSETNLADAVLQKHGHTNKTLLDTYAQSETDLADAVSKKHAHSNAAILAKFTEVDGKPKYDGQAIGGGETAPVTLGTSGAINIDRTQGDKFNCTPSATVNPAAINFTDGQEAILKLINPNNLVVFPDNWNWAGGYPPTQVKTGYNIIKLTASDYSGTIKINATNLFSYVDLSASLFLWLKFEGDNNSQTIIDSSGRHSSFTIGTNTKLNTSIKNGGVSSLKIDAGYLTVASSADFHFDGQFTMQCYIYLNTLNETSAIFSGSSYTNWELGNSGGSIRLWLNGVNHDVASALTMQTWHKIAFTRNAANLVKVWIDDVAVISLTDATDFPATALTIGARGTGGSPFDGYIDDVQIYNGACLY